MRPARSIYALIGRRATMKGSGLNWHTARDSERQPADFSESSRSERLSDMTHRRKQPAPAPNDTDPTVEATLIEGLSQYVSRLTKLEHIGHRFCSAASRKIWPRTATRRALSDMNAYARNRSRRAPKRLRPGCRSASDRGLSPDVAGSEVRARPCATQAVQLLAFADIRRRHLHANERERQALRPGKESSR